MTPRAVEFEKQGVLVLEGELDSREIETLRGLCEPLFGGAARARPGVRRVFEREPRLRDVIAGTRVTALAREFAGERAAVVRSILFDKSPETNWLVPWHQDSTVALRERVDTPGFGPWSVKEGEAHARPPREILDLILVVRLHLDDCGPDNGPLRVVPGSHLYGLIRESGLATIVEQGPVRECCVSSGGAVLMRPHVVHSSAKAERPSRRRVLHLEITDAVLPPGLEWGESVPI